MAKGTDLILSLFSVTSAREVPFGISQYIQCILQGFTNMLLCVPLIFADSKNFNLVVAHDGFLCVMKIVHIFHSGYLDYRGAFQTVFDLYCSVMS